MYTQFDVIQKQINHKYCNNHRLFHININLFLDKHTSVSTNYYEIDVRNIKVAH